MNDIYNYIKELTKFDIEFQDENNEFYSLNSYIKSVGKDKILIDAPEKNGKSYNFKDGQAVNILICNEEGILSGDSVVIGKEISSTPGIWISFPFNSYNIQRREYFRVPLNIIINMIIYKDRLKNERLEFSVSANDLSAKGFSYFSDEPLKDYYDIECWFSLDDGIEENIYSQCDHIYSTHQIAAGRNIRYINGFAFVNMKEDFVERIMKKAFKYQLEQRKKELI